jgi:PAS domain S-box-containing protein
MSANDDIRGSTAYIRPGKTAQEQLKFIQILIDAIPHPVFYMSTEVTFLGCNKAYADFCGMDREFIIGKTVHDIFPQETAEKFAEKDKELFEHTGTQSYEMVSDISMIVTKTTYSTTDGRPAGLIGVINDVTDQKHLEETLQMSEAYFRSFTESLRDCVTQISIDGKILSMNPTGCEILEFDSCDKAVGEDFTSSIIENREAVEGALQRTAKGETTSVICKSSGRKGKVIWWDAKFSPVTDIDGSIRNILAVSRDISEQKKLEMQLQEAQEAEKTILTEKNHELENAYRELKTAQGKILQQEKMASIGQLAAGVAHEINNPMGFIISNLGTLQKYIDKLSAYISAQTLAIQDLADQAALPQDVMARVDESRRSLKIDYIAKDLQALITESLDGTGRVKSIVQNFKSFSRIDQAEIQLADINECLETTINIVWNELKYKATLEKHLGNIPRTWCNPGQINQVFVNILVNAAQAIEKHGIIHVKTWRDNGAIKIAIRDTGCGIPPERLNRIFEPFYTTKEVGRGTGLGLSIVYDIVKKHNGEIAVQSEVNKGTTFTVAIPILERRQDEHTPTNAVR